MRLVFGKALPAEFERQMASQLPVFEPFRLRLTKEQRRTADVSPGELIFRWRATEQLHCFICILPDSRHDCFMIEAGWSTRGRFPHDLMSRTTASHERQEFSLAECLVHAAGLFNLRPGCVLASVALLGGPR